MRLQFRDKVSLTPSFAHWIETLTNPDPELRFSNARAALEALQLSNSPSSSIEIAGTESQETTRKARDRLFIYSNKAIALPHSQSLSKSDRISSLLIPIKKRCSFHFFKNLALSAISQFKQKKKESHCWINLPRSG